MRVIGVSQLVISILTSLWVYLILVRELNEVFKSLKVQILRLILFIVGHMELWSINCSMDEPMSISLQAAKVLSPKEEYGLSPSHSFLSFWWFGNQTFRRENKQTRKVNYNLPNLI